MIMWNKMKNLPRIHNVFHLFLLTPGKGETKIVQFSSSVVSDSLWPHGLQHARPPCPSPTPGITQTHVHWVGDAIQPSHPLSSPSPPASIFPSIRVFSVESVLPITWQKYWSFSFSISLSNEYSGLISFRMDWLDLLSVQGTLESPKHRFHHFYSEILFLRDTVPIIVFLNTAHTYPSCLIHILSHCQVHT